METSLKHGEANLTTSNVFIILNLAVWPATKLPGVHHRLPSHTCYRPWRRNQVYGNVRIHRLLFIIFSNKKHNDFCFLRKNNQQMDDAFANNTAADTAVVPNQQKLLHQYFFHLNTKVNNPLSKHFRWNKKISLKVCKVSACRDPFFQQQNWFIFNSGMSNNSLSYRHMLMTMRNSRGKADYPDSFSLQSIALSCWVLIHKLFHSVLVTCQHRRWSQMSEIPCIDIIIFL